MCAKGRQAAYMPVFFLDILACTHFDLQSSATNLYLSKQEVTQQAPCKLLCLLLL